MRESWQWTRVNESEGESQGEAEEGSSTEVMGQFFNS